MLHKIQIVQVCKPSIVSQTASKASPGINSLVHKFPNITNTRLN